MDYQQSREQSAELLRIVVALMGKQSAGFHPASYALWYEHAAGVNPSLSRALEPHISASTPLTDLDVRNLYTQHIVSRDRETIERVEHRLAELLEEASQVISRSGAHFMQFGTTLEDHATQLQQPPALEALQQIVGELLTETHQMRVTNLTLTRQLDSSAQEVLTLTERLERAQAEALYDPLTRLLNRRGFEEVVSKLYDGSTPLAGASLLLIDIDEFKKVNDTYGHLIGDQVLRAVAQILRARIKGADIASRLGGDEFAVLLPDTAIAGAVALAEQIRSTLLQRQLRLADHNRYVENLTMSIGVACAGNEASLESLLQQADIALYAAKRSGRNRVSSAGLTKSGR